MKFLLRLTLSDFFSQKRYPKSFCLAMCQNAYENMVMQIPLSYTKFKYSEKSLL